MASAGYMQWSFTNLYSEGAGPQRHFYTAPPNGVISSKTQILKASNIHLPDYDDQFQTSENLEILIRASIKQSAVLVNGPRGNSSAIDARTFNECIQDLYMSSESGSKTVLGRRGIRLYIEGVPEHMCPIMSIPPSMKIGFDHSKYRPEWLCLLGPDESCVQCLPLIIGFPVPISTERDLLDQLGGDMLVGGPFIDWIKSKLRPQPEEDEEATDVDTAATEIAASLRLRNDVRSNGKGPMLSAGAYASLFKQHAQIYASSSRVAEIADPEVDPSVHYIVPPGWAWGTLYAKGEDTKRLLRDQAEVNEPNSRDVYFVELNGGSGLMCVSAEDTTRYGATLAEPEDPSPVAFSAFGNMLDHNERNYFKDLRHRLCGSSVRCGSLTTHGDANQRVLCIATVNGRRVDWVSTSITKPADSSVWHRPHNDKHARESTRLSLDITEYVRDATFMDNGVMACVTSLAHVTIFNMVGGLPDLNKGVHMPFAERPRNLSESWHVLDARFVPGTYLLIILFVDTRKNNAPETPYHMCLYSLTEDMTSIQLYDVHEGTMTSEKIVVEVAEPWTLAGDGSAPPGFGSNIQVYSLGETAPSLLVGTKGRHVTPHMRLPQMKSTPRVTLEMRPSLTSPRQHHYIQFGARPYWSPSIKPGKSTDERQAESASMYCWPTQTTWSISPSGVVM